MRRQIPILLILLMTASLYQSEARADDATQTGDLARGRYLVSIGGCNDCHTPAFAERAGQVPDSEWLTGVAVGFQGPWGTSYPANLRLVAAGMDEKQFIARSRSQLLPPMPWFNLRTMSDDDLAAVYRFIRSLGPAGEPAPAYVPPGGQTQTPFVVFVPQDDNATPVAAR